MCFIAALTFQQLGLDIFQYSLDQFERVVVVVAVHEGCRTVNVAAWHRDHPRWHTTPGSMDRTGIRSATEHGFQLVWDVIIVGGLAQKAQNTRIDDDAAIHHRERRPI